MEKFIWKEQIKENKKGYFLYLDGFCIVDRNSIIRENVAVYEYKIKKIIKDKKGNDVKILYLYPHQHKFIPQEKGGYCEYLKCSECGEEKKIPHEYEVIGEIKREKRNIFSDIEEYIYEVKRCKKCGDTYENLKNIITVKEMKKNFVDFEELDSHEYFWEILYLEKKINFYDRIRDDIKELPEILKTLKTLPEYIENLYNYVDGYRIVEKDEKKILVYFWVITDPEDGEYYDNYSLKIPEEIQNIDINDIKFKLFFFYNDYKLHYRFSKLALFYRYSNFDYITRYQKFLKDIEMWERYVLPIREKIIDRIDKKIEKIEEEIKRIKNEYKKELIKYIETHKDEISPYVIECINSEPDDVIQKWYEAWKENKF
ncbi:MAG: hypothetical protein ACPL1F_07880 [bacterium]